MPILEVNLRWYVVGIKVLYEQDSFITEAGRPTRYFWDERRIELSGITGGLEED